ncbi:unnamed protein product [Paramecium sonneborni]|uniref:Uncharacterized protein n=1 Tax=Paramecium sonneborni TaxID=65129 RepID=A0A8S1K872_9CILI|nr:unnamed protein product [Paramecium sonneborni]
MQLQNKVGLISNLLEYIPLQEVTQKQVLQEVHFIINGLQSTILGTQEQNPQVKVFLYNFYNHMKLIEQDFGYGIQIRESRRYKQLFSTKTKIVRQ